jgi:Fe-S cluster assembly protein SufD
VGSQVEIECTSLQKQEQTCLALDLVDLVLEDESEAKMTWQRAASGLNLSFLRASVMKQAKLHFMDLSEGASISRLDAEVKLMEENSLADLRGLALVNGQNQNQTHVRIEHVAPSCESSQLFKALLKDRARSHFQGKIYVFPQAQQTQAYQLSRNLLLSEGAQAQSCPNLEIFADDVKASHGSTTGPVDPESLFYLLSRGIDKETATGLLAHGFAFEVLSSMSEGELLSFWKKKVMFV